MCLLIVKPKNTTIKNYANVVLNAFQGNPDGFGIAWRKSDGGTWAMKKGTWDVDTILKMTECLNTADTESVIHFRFATSGRLDGNTCHPFRMGNNRLLFHNGVFAGLGSNTMSDTQEAALMMKNETTDNAVKFFEELCGNYSKVVICENDKDIIIVNHELGEFIDGVWFSKKNSACLMDDPYEPDYSDIFVEYDEEWDDIRFREAVFFQHKHLIDFMDVPAYLKNFKVKQGVIMFNESINPRGYFLPGVTDADIKDSLGMENWE